MSVDTHATARSTPISVPGIIAAIIAFGTDCLYIAIIREQGNFAVNERRVGFIAANMATAGTAALAGALTRSVPLRLVLFGFATGALVGLGTVGFFSLGLLLLIAGIVAWFGWARSARSVGRRSRLLAWGMASLAIVFLSAGLATT